MNDISPMVAAHHVIDRLLKQASAEEASRKVAADSLYDQLQQSNLVPAGFTKSAFTNVMSTDPVAPLRLMGDLARNLANESAKSAHLQGVVTKTASTLGVPASKAPASSPLAANASAWDTLYNR